MPRYNPRLFLITLLIFSILLTSCGMSTKSISYVPEQLTREDVDFSDLPFYLPTTDKLNDLQDQYIQLSTNHLAHRTLFREEANNLFTDMLTLREDVAQSAGYNSFCEYEYAERFLAFSDIETYIANVKQTVLNGYTPLISSVHI